MKKKMKTLNLNVFRTSIRMVLHNMMIVTLLLSFCTYAGAKGASSANSVNAQQQKVISGVVNDQAGQPLPGVTIQVTGTTVGVLTDANGRFTLPLPENARTLSFSYIGMKTQVVTLGTQEVLNVVLEETAIDLDEVIVTGYSVEKKVDVKGSVAVVNTDNLRGIPAGSTVQALQGQTTGVTIIGGGTPGQKPNIWIRGVSTFGDTYPLVLIDGIEGDLNNINIRDIESMQVLKDAGAASIYGVRGANGVIIITTRKGKIGAPTFDYEFYYGVKHDLGRNPMNLMNSNEFMSVHKKAFPGHELFADGMPDYGYLTNTGAVGVAFEGDPIVDPSKYYWDPLGAQKNLYLIQKFNKEGTDWYDEIHSPAPQMNHNFTASGGTQSSNYLISLGYLNEYGTLLDNRLQRYSLRSNTSFKFKDKIRVGQNLSMYYRKNPRIPESQVLGSEFSPIAMHGLLLPIIPVYDIAGHFGGTRMGPDLGTQRNPVAYFDHMKQDMNNYWNVSGNIYAEVDILKNFTARVSFGGNLGDGHTSTLLTPTPERSEFYNDPIRYTEGHSYNSQLITTNTLAYKNTFGKHDVSVLGGMEAIKNQGRSLSASRDGYFVTTTNFLILNAGQGNYQNSGNATGDALLSFFGSLNYSFDSRYLVGVTLRRDGSSRFGIKSRWGTFPSFSGAWRISKESFMNNISWLTDLKLRGSYGVLGSQNNVSAINQFDVYSGTVTNAYYDLTGSSNSALQGFTQTRIGNPETSWERNIVTNIGLDMTIFDKLSWSFEVYKKSIDGLLFALSLPATVGGATRPSINAGDIENIGFDLEAKYMGDINKTLYFTLTGNISAYKNKVTALPGRDYFDGGNGTRNQPGFPISSWRGYVVGGIYQSTEDVASRPGYNGAEPGRLWYKDLNGDGLISSTFDQTFIGNPHPDFIYGFLLDATYKNFDLSANFYGSQGNQIQNQMKVYIYRMGGYLTNVSKDLLNAWSPENPDTMIPLISVAGGLGHANTRATYNIEDGSFFRLRSLILGYTLPSGFMQRIGFSKFRVYAQGTNLFTLTKYSGLDPEIGGSGANFGTDLGNYPNSEKTFLIGVNCSF